MNLRNVGLLYRKEMTDLLRDRRTIFTMMVLPLLIMPISMAERVMCLSAAEKTLKCRSSV